MPPCRSVQEEHFSPEMNVTGSADNSYASQPFHIPCVQRTEASEEQEKERHMISACVGLVSDDRCAACTHIHVFRIPMSHTSYFKQMLTPFLFPLSLLLLFSKGTRVDAVASLRRRRKEKCSCKSCWNISTAFHPSSPKL